MRVRHLMPTAALFAVLLTSVGCAPTPAPVSEKVQQYYDQNVATPRPLAKPLQMSVIGDSYTGGSNEGGDPSGPNNWVVAATAKLNADDAPVLGAGYGIGGSGYVSRGPNGKIFVDLVPETLTVNTDVAVFFGSINDKLQPIGVVATAVDKTFASAKTAAPQAKFLVIGPAWVDSDVPADILAIRDTVSQAADKFGFTFVDPIAERWFFDNPELIGADGIHPTDAGHLYMAEKIAPHLKAVIPKK